MAEEEADPPQAGALVRALPVGVALITAPGVVSWANDAYFAATGRSREILGQDYHGIVEADGTWSTSIRAAMDAVLADGRPTTFREVRARHRNRPGGVYLDLEVRRLPDGPERRARALVTVQDVTERVEEHVRADVFYASFRSSTNAMQLTDERGLMIDVNPAYERIYGYTRAECIGRRPNLVRSRYTPSEVYDQMWKELTDPGRGYWSGEIHNRDRAGRERPVLLSITSVRGRDDAITNYLGVAVDLSERRDWELRVAHSDKLASVGQLAAGVAHEINTPLANVMLIAESLRKRSDDPYLVRRLDQLTEQVEVAARIVRSLLDFARRDAPHPQDLDLREVVQAAVQFVRGKQSEDVEVRERLASGPVPVSVDRQQIMQVLANLLNNAFDALEGRGAVEVRVTRGPTHAQVEVVDNGPGFSTEILPHIFEPFFTTKPEGKGTGLGLAVCHGIVQAHHGTIEAYPVEGGGAGFRIRLPLRRDPAAPAGPAPGS
jgi:two-component system cell cycle sensor histidine kinase/response regulator CckA